MGFFNETAATTLQYFSFPLEVIGLTLALIEVRFPATAARLTRIVERLAEPVSQLRRHRQTRQESEMAIERALGNLLSRVLTVGFLLLFVYFVLRLLVAAVSGGLSQAWLIGYVVALLITSIAMAVSLTLLCLLVYFMVIGGSDFAQRFVAGRAIGTLGILIAGFGALGEGYQFLQQIINA